MAEFTKKCLNKKKEIVNELNDKDDDLVTSI